ncbi:MAG: phosphopantothenoylcysteine decarboxylase, partial [Pseudomonadota bacterium]
RGAQVTLVHGPVALAAPPGVLALPVSTAAEMAGAVRSRFAEADAVIMVAAVADYRPATVLQGKRSKTPGSWEVTLERTEDILASLGRERQGQVLVGFAAETGEVQERARQKLLAKGLDLIVANDVSRNDAGFGAERNAGLLLAADGVVEELPLMAKREMASRLLDHVARLLRERQEVRGPG